MKAAVRVTSAIASAIRELGSVPAGTLYSNLIGRMSLDTFEQIIGLLVREKLVARSESHLLTWTGEAQLQPSTKENQQ